MAVIAATNVELKPTDCWLILKTLEILAHPDYNNQKMSYTSTSIILGTNSGWWRGLVENYNYYTGQDSTTNMDALPRLILKVKACITTNETILQKERSKYIDQIPLSICGLETLKENQYKDQAEQEGFLDASIESLKSAKATLEAKRKEWVATQLEHKRFQREANAAEKSAELAKLQDENGKLKEENKTLKAQLEAKEVLGSPSFDGIPKEKLFATIRLLMNYLEQKV